MPAVFLAYVKDLALCLCVAVITWVLVVLAVKSGLWHGIVNRIVLPRGASDGGPDLTIISMVLSVIIVSAMLLTTMGSSLWISGTTWWLRALR